MMPSGASCARKGSTSSGILRGASALILSLERSSGFVFTSSGKLVRGLKSTYKRHGTINLFAALNMASGVIQSKTTKTKKNPDFQAFLDEVVADVRADREVHVILTTNLSYRFIKVMPRS